VDDQETGKTRWGVERRLEFIEFRLFWEGGVNRSDIVSAFGVSVPQASKDLTLYQERAPPNAIYDKSAKRYVAGPDFRPLFHQADPDAYLQRLRARADGLAEAENSWIGKMPPTDMALTPHRSVGGAVLRALLKAIHEQLSVQVLYQSMNDKRPDPEWRRITPHSLANDGFRWHARAFCHIDERFKDFLLTRVFEARDFGQLGLSIDEDRLWQEKFELMVGPHPKLAARQRAGVERDYGMTDGRLLLSTRKAMLFYVLKRLGLLRNAVNEDPHEQHIVDLDRERTERELRELGISF
jgi:hypothetical protein